MSDQIKRTCPECNGEGVDPYTYFRCGACQGAGKVTAPIEGPTDPIRAYLDTPDGVIGPLAGWDKIEAERRYGPSPVLMEAERRFLRHVLLHETNHMLGMHSSLKPIDGPHAIAETPSATD